MVRCNRGQRLTTRQRGSMYCVQLVYENGGSRTILGDTIEECKSKVTVSRASFCFATVPYEVFLGAGGAYDVSVPGEWRDAMGHDAVKKIGHAE